MALLCLLIAAGTGAAMCLPTEVSAESADLPCGKAFNYLYKDIYVDGYHINNYQLDHSVMVSGGSTYIPLDELFLSMLGLQIQPNVCDENILELRSVEPVHFQAPEDLRFVSNHFQGTEGIRCGKDLSFALVDEFTKEDDYAAMQQDADRKKVFADFYGDYLAMYMGPAGKGFAKAALGIEPLFEGFGTPLSITPNDYYFCGDVPYIRLTALTESPEFTYSAYFDDFGGLAISTDPDQTAEEQFSESNAGYIKGRVGYMRHCQKGLSENDAVYMEYIFRHEATVNGISEDLIMGVARIESRYSLGYFNNSPIGIMQLMPATVTRGGYSLSFAKTVHGNIQFGAAYIARNVRVYKGEIPGLSAYNQGGGPVSSGEYSTAYAEKALGFRSELRSYCSSRGYSNEFLSVSEKVTQ